MINVGYSRSIVEGYESLAFQDDASGETLEFRRALGIAAGGVGMGSYVIVHDDAVYVGGLIGFTLTGVVLALTLDEEAAEVLGLPGDLDLRLNVAGAATVAELLPPIVGG